MNKYRAEHLGREGASPQNYRYAIWQGAKRVAEFGHDFRNDERWLIVKGTAVAVVIDLLAGGGPQPLVVSEAGAELLDNLLEY